MDQASVPQKCWPFFSFASQSCFKQKMLFFLSKLPFELQLELSFWFLCNLLLVFITQLRFHIWQGTYQRMISGSHTSIMAPVTLQHYEASVRNPCDLHIPCCQHHSCSYLKMAKFDKGHLMILAQKSQQWNVDRTTTLILQKGPTKRWCPIL